MFIGSDAILHLTDLAIKNRKIMNYTYFQDTIAEMILKVDQGHWKWHHLIDRTRVSISVT